MVIPPTSPQGGAPAGGGEVPPEQLGLMLQVKAYERRTIEALAGGSDAPPCTLAVHPLVRMPDWQSAFSTITLPRVLSSHS